jgi:hypothetical protein
MYGNQILSYINPNFLLKQSPPLFFFIPIDRTFEALQETKLFLFSKGKSDDQKSRILSKSASEPIFSHLFSNQRFISQQNQYHIRNQHQKLD